MLSTFDSKPTIFCLASIVWLFFCGTYANAQDTGYIPLPIADTQVPIVDGTNGIVVQSPIVQAQTTPPIVQACETAQPAANDSAAIEALNKKIASAHKLTFFDNDFSYLCDPNYCGWNLGDRLKNKSLFGGAKLSVGGQYRMRAHFEQNMRGLGLTGVDDQFILHRTRIYADLKLNQNIRVYGEMIDAQSDLENFGPRPIEVNRTDFLNLFVDAKLMSGPGGDLSARVGRQEMALGAQRLVSPLDWANTRRSFEGIRGTLKNSDFTLDGFWMNPIRVNDSSLDSPDQDQEFMGLYSSFSGVENQTMDAYFLRYLNGRGTNAFAYNTVGLRFQGSHNAMLWDCEGAYQYGTNTDGSNHVAGMMTFGVGRKYDDYCMKPTVWMYYDWASGDDSLGAGNGFHHNFPLAHKYNGFMDLFGRRNLEDFNIQASVNPNKKLKLLAWYHYLALETKTDSPYSVVMTPFNGGNAPGSADLGHEIDLIASYKVNARQNLLFGYSKFFGGEYYSTTPGVPFNGDAEFYYAQWTVNF